MDAHALLAEVTALEDKGDPEALDKARHAYLDADPEGPDAVRVKYQLGMSYLFRLKDTEGAMGWFKAAAQDKSTDIAKEARISYALLLNAKQKRQQAIFELKKLLPAGVEPSIHTANALDFLTLLLRESKAADRDIEKAETQRQEHLIRLVETSSDPAEKAQWLLRLGAAYVDSNGPGESAKAKKAFTDVVKLGRAAGDSAIKSARTSLRTLPR